MQDVLVGLILAEAEVMNVGAIANASTTAVAASAANVTLCVFMLKHSLMLCIKEF